MNRLVPCELSQNSEGLSTVLTLKGFLSGVNFVMVSEP